MVFEDDEQHDLEPADREIVTQHIVVSSDTGAVEARGSGDAPDPPGRVTEAVQSAAHEQHEFEGAEPGTIVGQVQWDPNEETVVDIDWATEPGVDADWAGGSTEAPVRSEGRDQEQEGDDVDVHVDDDGPHERH